MTASKTATMADDGPAIGDQIKRSLLLGACAIVALFAIGVIFGLLAAHGDGGEPADARLIGLIGAAGLVALGALYGGYRALRGLTAPGETTSRERRGRQVLLACVALGGLSGVALAMTGSEPFGFLSDDPLPPVLAILLAIPIAVLVPLLSLYWHRRVADEQESAAYNKGALMGIYAFWIGAPTWWLLWRGGLVPAPSGVAIYCVTIAVAGLVWLWAKYR